MRVSFVHEQIPVAVEYAAVGPSGQQTGGRGWWWWTGPGCGRSLQEQVCIQRLEWQLLETVCFRFKTKASSILVFRKIIIKKKKKGSTSQGGYSRMLFFGRGTSHSGEANSFSPSELLLCPGSGAEPVDNSFAKMEGRPSSSFPSAAKNKQVSKCGCLEKLKGRVVVL